MSALQWPCTVWECLFLAHLHMHRCELALSCRAQAGCWWPGCIAELHLCSCALSWNCVHELQLAEGILVEISPKLIKRQKQHFVNLDGLGELQTSPPETAACLNNRRPFRGLVMQSAAVGLQE